MASGRTNFWKRRLGRRFKSSLGWDLPGQLSTCGSPVMAVRFSQVSRWRSPLRVRSGRRRALTYRLLCPRKQTCRTRPTDVSYVPTTDIAAEADWFRQSPQRQGAENRQPSLDGGAIALQLPVIRRLVQLGGPTRWTCDERAAVQPTETIVIVPFVPIEEVYGAVKPAVGGSGMLPCIVRMRL